MENIGALIGHVNLEPLVYGIIMFIGLSVTWHKLIHGKWLNLMIDIGVFYLVFSLHGGSMSGGFSAMIAAMLASLIFPTMLRRAFT